MKKQIIIINSARCKKCHEEIFSTWVHDFSTCHCGAISVDGGTDYLKRSAMDLDDYEDTSIIEEVDEVDEK